MRNTYLIGLATAIAITTSAAAQQVDKSTVDLRQEQPLACTNKAISSKLSPERLRELCAVEAKEVLFVDPRCADGVYQALPRKLREQVDCTPKRADEFGPFCADYARGSIAMDEESRKAYCPMVPRIIADGQSKTLLLTSKLELMLANADSAGAARGKAQGIKEGYDRCQRDEALGDAVGTAIDIFFSE